MTSRRKGKKNNKSKAKPEDPERTTKCNPYMFFKTDEISRIKSTLKIKEVLNIPIVIGCVILNKLDVLEKVIDSTVRANINEVGPNNTTPLIWAVRYKYLDIIKFLLEHGANPTIKAENGETIVVIALEHKLWDESNFISFWNMVSNVVPIDVNTTNKNDHTILHIAVRREWENFVKKLLIEKVNIDRTNINGVTPLMTACFRNNLSIVDVLIDHGADFTMEDNHYRTALCYAIVTGAKIGKAPPFKVAERIIFELKKDFAFKEYIKRRIEIINLILSKDKISDQESDMLVTLTHYLVQYTENGLKLILDFKIFDLIQKVLKKIFQEDKRKLLLQLIQELLCYNELVVGFNCEVQLKLSNQFFGSNLPASCLEIFKKEKNLHYNAALYIIIMFCTLNEVGYHWMKQNYVKNKQMFSCLLVDCNSYIQKDFMEERRLKLMKKKIKKLKRLVNTLETGKTNQNKIVAEKKSEPLFNIKKSRRRTKALKAKISKVKSLDLAERLSLKSNVSKVKEKKRKIAVQTKLSANKIICDHDKIEENILEQPLSMFELQVAREIEDNQRMVKTFMTDDIYCPFIEEDDSNPISSSLKEFLQVQQAANEKGEPSFGPTFPEWKAKIHKMPFNDWSLFGSKMKFDKSKLKAAIQYIKKLALNHDNTSNTGTLDAALQVVVEYLKELLDIIVCRSKVESEGRQETQNKNGKKSNYIEKQAFGDLQANFNHLISSIRSLAHSNLTEALKNIYQLESNMLRFPINGKSLLSDVCALENAKIQYTTYSYQTESSFLTYMENVLNGFEEAKDDIKITVIDGLSTVLETEPPGLYLKEMSLLSKAKPKNKRKELEDKVKTMEYAYHLTESILDLVKDEDELSKKDVFQNLDVPKSISEPTAKLSDMVLQMLTKHTENDKGSRNEKSRWAEKIRYLESMKDSSLVLGGDIRLSRYPDRNHIISHGGNFNLVTLGLSMTNQPLAIKKIPSKHSLCLTLKSLINPLLGIRNKHILPYFICDYEETNLILATPLCEYNISQYVLLLKENAEKNVFNLSQMEIIRQFLNGLAFLHQRAEPIVHGNLKPSNIFVDINGVVKVAEFGIHKALLKLIEAPTSSLIWFSQETYKMYKISFTMECSLASDIQVAGMIIYFVASGGAHPFGLEVTTILKNLEKASFTLPPMKEVKNQIFADLVSWMLMFEPSERPQIQQILSHVLFWTNDRRWRFILNCSGVPARSIPPTIKVNKMHDLIEEIAIREQINGHWVELTQKTYPHSKIDGADTLVGLLKFVKHFYESQEYVDLISNEELRSCLLINFPALPLTLYRILEVAGFMRERPFVNYTFTESLIG